MFCLCDTKTFYQYSTNKTLEQYFMLFFLKQRLDKKKMGLNKIDAVNYSTIKKIKQKSLTLTKLCGGGGQYFSQVG